MKNIKGLFKKFTQKISHLWHKQSVVLRQHNVIAKMALLPIMIFTGAVLLVAGFLSFLLFGMLLLIAMLRLRFQPQSAVRSDQVIIETTAVRRDFA
ncbi:hypothetical protein A1D23_11015 [Chelonobacter oris]|uniref:Uncharacterized protein n=2 Tax=Chelonobacter oris TaxID=505317 RepID=A0A0A3AKZ1_9PAST|nr:hypothetical protein OA57_08345 [Chelonobacter oris]MDH3000985.1 hypothetical protein [Chelonobacter oris]